MLVVSGGLIKSGSGWFFNLTNDLVVEAGGVDVRGIRHRFPLARLLRNTNCNAGRLFFPRTAALLFPHGLRRTFVVKTHGEPTRSLRIAEKAGWAKTTYIFRDPRDVALSIYDHGKELRDEGIDHPFARCTTVREAVDHAAEWLWVWDAWQNYDRAFKVRYESLVSHTEEVLEALASFLDLTLSPGDCRRVADRYRIEDSEDQEGLHANKGVARRYREEMDDELLRYSKQRFGEYLSRMGYA